MFIEQSNELKSFKLMSVKSYNKIKNGDSIKYFVGTQFKHGGIVKHVGYPDYIVLVNWSRKLSWSVQLKNPDLQIWIKKKETLVKERLLKKEKENGKEKEKEKGKV